ncbi:hypothetical protein [Sphingobacterium sp. DR205]|uniref:hypothetical protein n=1 Tax=Sphingobacterium sp. DR205 TaxID=2713573 RepID=UPI0013E4BBB5|nr:hypothetical protein [Sphingobacterium sp. DR205]QIH32769.1 hypothetical protein G6053_07615 [Sphingobacterium sp. DR205]
MRLEELTLEIYAERALTYFESKHLVAWAVNVLTLGYESDNLYVLAVWITHLLKNAKSIFGNQLLI